MSPTKHNPFLSGLYSQYFTEEDKQMLEEPGEADLMIELAILRLSLAQLIVQLNDFIKKKSPPAP
jgi:hypothetical protein